MDSVPGVYFESAQNKVLHQFLVNALNLELMGGSYTGGRNTPPISNLLHQKIVYVGGDNTDEATLLPIPNRTVKLIKADGSAMRKSR